MQTYRLLIQEQAEQMAKFIKANRDERATGKGSPKHAALKDTDDLDQFLTTFQTHMKNFQVARAY